MDQVCVDGRCEARPPPSDGGDDDDAGPGRLDAGPTATLVSIAIEPATADLVSVDGSMPTQAFSVVATFSDMSTRPLAGPTFGIAPVSLGEIDVASGAFTANGIIGGSATVTATVPNPAGGELMATATVNVRLERTIIVAGAPADVATRFTGTPMMDDARRAQLVYPLDRAVMPQNVYPADMQWLRGGAGDFFRIALVKPSASITAYLAHDGSLQNHWLVDEPAWRSLAQTDPDADAMLTVDRYEGASGEVIAGAPIRLTFARAALTGSVYYWDIARGRIVRIDDGTATRDEFMPNPPEAQGGSRCVGCHAVSNSGRYMAGRLGGSENIGAVFDLTTDLSGDPPATVFPLRTAEPSSIRWWFSSWSPDDTRMVASTSVGSSLRRLTIYDPFAGAELPYTGTPPDIATHPAWSPDGTQIAYTSNINSWGGANTTGNIATVDISGVAFGTARDVHDGASLSGEAPGGVTDSYPTWSPDSALIAFMHGTGSRSDTRDAGAIQYAALYIMARDGSGVQRLDNVSAPSSMSEDFQPRFSPFTQGGYFWLSFLSRRDYGNAEVGTRGARRQQIWITAISESGAGDPSSVPYWLPGQNTASENISAYWAPRPCRPDGEGCSVGSECCGGDCRPGAGGTLVCSPPPPERCRMFNETCSTDADCCDTLSCISNVCVRAPE